MNNSIKNVAECNEVSPFMHLLSDDQLDHNHESRYFIDDEYQINHIKRGIKIRDGSNDQGIGGHIFSRQFVIQQALDRYFKIYDAELYSMSEMFSEKEMLPILNANCSSYWPMRGNNTLAGMLADDQGIECLSELDENNDLRMLIEKLEKLTVAQNMALADVCEQFWRNGINGKSITDVFAELHLNLSQSSN